MVLCMVCKKRFDNLNLLQRHFAFKNGEEFGHQNFKNKQIAIAQELFLKDRSGDTFYILRTHPEINLISEKALRLIWIDKYGKKAVEKRRVEIGNKKRIETIYEPRRIKKESELDKQCPVCEFKYTGNISLSHHICAKRDKVHRDLIEQQRLIALRLFNEDRTHSIAELLKLNPEFILSEAVFRNKFWAQEFGKQKMAKRRNEVSGKSRIGIRPWNSGLTKNNNHQMKHMSMINKEKYKLGIPHLNTEENIEKLKLAYSERRKIAPSLVPGASQKISQTMISQYECGSRKPPHGLGGKRPDLKHFVRSAWEANFARILNRLRIPYEYEPEKFILRDESGKTIGTYTPDFKLKGRYYEIKGVIKSSKEIVSMHPGLKKGIMKIKLFKEQYPEIKYRLIGKKEYKRIIGFFKQKIDFEMERSSDMITIKNSEICITKDEWAALNIKLDKERIKKLLSSAILDNKLELPYQKISSQQASDDFLQLKNLDTSTLLIKNKFASKYDYKYSFLKSYIDSSNIGSQSSNFFQQENRFRCDSIISPSPFRVWNSEKFLNSMLGYLWSMKVKEVNNGIFRTALGVRKYVASQFKPSVAKYVYDNFAGKGRVLDFSAGWGDRLAGFYASNQTSKYVGIDPNKSVFDVYSQQSELYRSLVSDKKDVSFINSPAEDVKLDEEFDLIFTSPPYFDLERYSKDDSQSWKRYKKKDAWLDGFLFKTIGSFWNNLSNGGYLIINIADVYSHHQIQKMCDPMNDFIAKLNGSSYVGAIGMRMAQRPNSKVKSQHTLCEPMWIWKKTC